MTDSLLTLTDYLALPCPEQSWLIDDLLPVESFVVLWGPAKSGKTLLSLQVGLSLAQGRPMLGHRVPHQRTVLLLELDTGHRLLRAMLDNVRQSGVDLSGPFYAPNPDLLRKRYPVNLRDQSSVDFVSSLISSCQPSLVIVDCLRELGDHNENESGDTKVVVSALKALTVFNPQFPCACLLLHHTRKLDDRTSGRKRAKQVKHDPIEVGRGSGYLSGAVDAVWFLHDNLLQIKPRFTSPSEYNLVQKQAGWWHER